MTTETVVAQVKAALDAATLENEYPHEYERSAEAIVREIHDWSGIVGFDAENGMQMREAVETVERWRLDNPKPKG